MLIDCGDSPALALNREWGSGSTRDTHYYRPQPVLPHYHQGSRWITLHPREALDITSHSSACLKFKGCRRQEVGGELLRATETGSWRWRGHLHTSDFLSVWSQEQRLWPGGTLLCFSAAMETGWRINLHPFSSACVRAAAASTQLFFFFWKY